MSLVRWFGSRVKGSNEAPHPSHHHVFVVACWQWWDAPWRKMRGLMGQAGRVVPARADSGAYTPTPAARTDCHASGAMMTLWTAGRRVQSHAHCAARPRRTDRHAGRGDPAQGSGWGGGGGGRSAQAALRPSAWPVSSRIRPCAHPTPHAPLVTAWALGSPRTVFDRRLNEKRRIGSG